MIKNFINIAILLLFFTTCAYAQKVKIRVLSAKDVKSVVFTTVSGEYDIFVDTVSFHFDSNDIVQITVNGDKLAVRCLNGEIGNFSTVKLMAATDKSSFKIKSAIPELKPRVYDDNLIISVKDKFLLIVNDVELENYVAGVVESEGGNRAEPEFYKTQAVLCRTWALYNFDKHLADGFQLCDDVHCQAYHNKCLKNTVIIDAAKFTEGLVITDTAMTIITATFHSNCGGQTVKSEDLWGKAKPYLQSVQDTFCMYERCAYWEKKISLDTFINYLHSNGFRVGKNTWGKDSMIFSQPGRMVWFSAGGDSMLLKKMRADLKLRSTFFSVYRHGKDVVFKGKGYGHGVGLCQEGAMRMAKIGYKFEDIIKFYYKNTNLVSMKALDFFNANVSSAPVVKDSLQVTPSEKPIE